MSEELDGVEAADAAIAKRMEEKRNPAEAQGRGEEGSGDGVAKGASVAADATDGEGVAKGAKVADEATDEGPHLLSEKETPEWTPEQREYLDGKFRERIGKYVKRAKAAEERLAELEKEAAAAGERKEEEWRRAVAARGIPPELVTKEEGETLKRWDELRKAQGFYRRHFSAGYEASGKGEDTVSLDAGEVQAEYLKVTEELTELAPRAGAIRERVDRELMERFRGKREAERPPEKRVALPKPPAMPERRGVGAGARTVGREDESAGRFDGKRVHEAEDVGDALDAETRRLVEMRRKRAG